MFICRENEFFGVGDTLLESFEDMVDNMLEAEVLQIGDEGPDPRDCRFYEEIAVNIESKTTWDIRPQHEFVDD